MKKLLLASTAVVLSAGVAAAEVSLSGDGRMGIVYNSSQSNEFMFTSRTRVTFTLSGETDGGLAFGGSFRADNAGAASTGTGGSVFISGEWGRITMGDTAGAAQFVVGHVSGVGLTGLGDLNESFYLGNQTTVSPGGFAATRPTARYDYSLDGFTFALSHTNPGNTNPVFGGSDTVGAIAVGYEMDMFSVGIGHEMLRWSGTNAQHTIIGASVNFEGIEVAANYGRVNSGAGFPNRDQYSLSVSGSFDATSVTAYYSRNFGGADTYGIGASHDLGGGASLVGGVVRTNSSSTTGTWTQVLAPDANRRTMADFGISFSF